MTHHNHFFNPCSGNIGYFKDYDFSTEHRLPELFSGVPFAESSLSFIMADSQTNDSNTCVVCFKNVLYYSIGECDHPVCFECSTRMRVLCLQNECPICRHDLARVRNSILPLTESEICELLADFIGDPYRWCLLRKCSLTRNCAIVFSLTGCSSGSLKSGTAVRRSKMPMTSCWRIAAGCARCRRSGTLVCSMNTCGRSTRGSTVSYALPT